MKSRLVLSLGRACVAGVCFALSVASHAQTPGVLLVNHAPVISGGSSISGSVQQMLAESATLNGNAAITGTWFVPGTPTVRLNGHPSFGGTSTGHGAATPTNFSVTLNGNSQLGLLCICTDAVPLPTVSAPAAPAGTRSVSLNRSTDPLGDFATLRNLTLNGNVGQITIPPGTYGDFSANGNSGFTVGVAGATQPSVYAFQHLTLNGKSGLQVVGPVVITVANGVAVNGDLGASAHPEWLILRIAAGDFTLNGNVAVAAYVTAPNGTVTINGSSQLMGGVTADRLVANGSGLLRLINTAPTVTLTGPADGMVATAPIASLALTASAADVDGYLAKVEFFSGATKLGESTTPPYQFTWTAIPAGTYAITAKATDNSGASTTSASATVISNLPPTVSLTAPANGSVLAAPASFTVAANAADADGTVAKVEFFQNGAKIGESAAAPYQVVLSGIASGTYTFSARATDNYSATADSATCTLVADDPPTAAVAGPATVSRGSGITLTASAGDADGSIAKVEFYRGGKLLGTVTGPTGTPPAYAFTDTDALAPGAYTYTVRSYDNLGLFTDSTATAVSVLATLPYTADFEDGEGYALGPINRQFGWTATSDSAVVTDENAFNGVHSIAIAPGTPPVRVAQVFAPYPGHDIVFMDFFTRPVAEADITNSTTFDVEGARFAFVQNGATAVLNVFHGDGSGGGTWQPTAFSTPIGPDNQVQSWTRLTGRLDFTHKTWDLYAGGSMVAADVPFRDSTATYLSSFAVRGDAATVSRLDYIFAGADNPLFADTNNNGIDDAWETAHGLSLTTYNRNDSPSGSGVTVIQAYQQGTDPNDFYNGVAPQLTPLGSAEDGLASDGTIGVKVTNAAGAPWVNAPVTFVPTQGNHHFAATPDGTPVDKITVRTDATGTARVYVISGGQ